MMRRARHLLATAPQSHCRFGQVALPGAAHVRDKNAGCRRADWQFCVKHAVIYNPVLSSGKHAPRLEGERGQTARPAWRRAASAPWAGATSPSRGAAP